MNLNPKQKQFCEEYIIDLNRTQASIRAGYSVKTAKQIGSKLLTKVDIQDYVAELMEERSKRTEVTADRVIKELATIAFVDIREAFDDKGNLLPIKQLPENVARAIAGIDLTEMRKRTKNGQTETDEEWLKRLKLIDKKGALELLGRNLAMFIDVNRNVNITREAFKGEDPEKYVNSQLSENER